MVGSTGLFQSPEIILLNLDGRVYFSGFISLAVCHFFVNRFKCCHAIIADQLINNLNCKGTILDYLKYVIK